MPIAEVQKQITSQVWTDLLSGKLSPGAALQMLTSIMGDTAAQNFIDTAMAERQKGVASGATWAQPPLTVNPLVPGISESPETKATRQKAFLEQEAEPGNVFRQYLQGQPRYGRLSGLGQEAMEAQYQPLLQSFRAQATDPTATFRDYLKGDGQALSPQAMQTRLGQIAGYFDVDPSKRTEEQAFMVDPTRYGSNLNAFQAYLQPLLSRVNPQFRAAVGNVAQGIYDLFQGQRPDQPFMQEMARRGGFFGGR